MSSRTVTTNPTSAPPRGGGFHVGTLIVAAISAVVAATVVSRLWQPGTVMATAIAVRPPREPAEEPPAPAVVVTADEGMTPMRVYRPGRKVRRRWKLALAIGLLAFLIAVAAMTVPELVAG